MAAVRDTAGDRPERRGDARLGRLVRRRRNRELGRQRRPDPRSPHRHASPPLSTPTPRAPQSPARRRAAAASSDNSVTIMRDATPPTITCDPTPASLWPPNGTLVPVGVAVRVSDATSGPSGFELAGHSHQHRRRNGGHRRLRPRKPRRRGAAARETPRRRLRARLHPHLHGLRHSGKRDRVPRHHRRPARPGPRLRLKPPGAPRPGLEGTREKRGKRPETAQRALDRLR